MKLMYCTLNSVGIFKLTKQFYGYNKIPEKPSRYLLDQGLLNWGRAKGLTGELRPRLLLKKIEKIWQNWNVEEINLQKIVFCFEEQMCKNNNY